MAWSLEVIQVGFLTLRSKLEVKSIHDLQIDFVGTEIKGTWASKGLEKEVTEGCTSKQQVKAKHEVNI
jgi:hypothetical protein